MLILLVFLLIISSLCVYGIDYCKRCFCIVTKEIKNQDDKEKIKIIKSLWKIIYSNKDADMYETNLMRRLAGLLYIDKKIMGDIKEKIKKEISS